MQHYFHRRFPLQIQRLNLRPADDAEVCALLRNRPHAAQAHEDRLLFFGSLNWANAEADLTGVPMTDRPQFLLSLFMLVATDQTLQMRFDGAYPRWRQLTYIPKFGPTPQGLPDANPYELLWVPERERLVDGEFALIFVNEFVEFMFEQLGRFLGEVLPELPPSRVFDCIVDDPRAAAAHGVLATAVRAELAHVWRQRLREKRVA